MFDSLPRSLSLAALLTLVVIALIGLTLGGLGWHEPELRPLKVSARPPRELVPVSRAAPLLSLKSFPAMMPSTNTSNPFYTAYFQPPPPAKPPATRKVDLIYEGFYETAAGLRKAFVKVGDGQFVGSLSNQVIGDLVVLEITHRSLSLKNAAGQTNVLPFNARTTVEIPAP